MHFLKRQFQLYINSEVANLRQRLRNSSITLTLFLVAGILFVFAMGFVLFACYHLMIDTWHWEAWQAGLLIAAVLGVVVAGLLFKVFSQPPPQPGVKPEPKPRSPTETPVDNDTESGLKLGEEVGKSLQRHYRENSLDLIVAAMVLGVVTGARQGRRRPQKGKQSKRNQPEK